MKSFSKIQNQVTIIQAVAGSGKTTLLKNVLKEARTTAGLTKEQILFVTYSRALAKELREELGDLARVTTLHALGLSLIRQNLEYFSFKKIPKRAKNNKDRDLFLLVNSSVTPEAVLKKFYRKREYKGQFTGTVCRELSIPNNLGKTLINRVNQRKREENVCSYADMIRLGSTVCQAFLKKKEISFDAPRLLLVDEYQDFNAIEKRFVLRLINISETSLVVGDDRQAIYSFKGASCGAVRKLAKKLPESSYTSLDHTYRLTKPTAALVNACPDRKKYPIIKSSKEGGIPFYHKSPSRELALDAVAKKIKNLIDQGGRPNEIAVITRFKKDFRQFTYFLSKHDIKIGVSDLPKDEENILQHFLAFSEAVLDLNNKKLKDYLEYYYGLNEKQAQEVALSCGVVINRQLLNIDDKTATKCRRVLNGVSDLRRSLSFDKLKRTFKERCQGKVDAYHHLGITSILNRYGLLINFGNSVKDVLVKLKMFLDNPERDGIYVGTQHKAKGKAWDHVFLIDVFDENRNPLTKNWDRNSELNLFHVAITRPKQRLYLFFFEEYQAVDSTINTKKKRIKNVLTSFLPKESFLLENCEVEVIG
ncbi:UvrD-helicase domain-containing protein [Thiorhodovibrio frisius]|uniref:DNA 3'-5' helicase n=1 Tax=Thiorhodovibrio frisius TaxID=631362 RepID=H8Z5E3_9GAMM|nr:ATP-dependent helicase [Thiorhodovibrio frisius]EIC19489.1 DNA/RNA helicase, superfamily I [Thiorhodovibrio frisius]WPL20547.1 ATP-dependent DNA helicase UvrD2 [Thiorhodovibrio frisius]